MWIASIVHLTDIHLYLSLDGKTHRPVEHEAHIKFLEKQAYRFDSVRWRKLFAGLSEHRPTALRMLKSRLPEVIREERREAIRVHRDADGRKLPIVIAQTGDVEAYGARRDNRGNPCFPGWRHLQASIAPLLEQADKGNEHAWIDIFGNHDVWGGAVPAHPATGAPRCDGEDRGCSRARRTLARTVPTGLALERRSDA